MSHTMSNISCVIGSKPLSTKRFWGEDQRSQKYQAMSAFFLCILTCIVAATASPGGSSPDNYVFVGDMKLSIKEKQVYFGKPTKAMLRKVWPDNTIYYEIDDALIQQHVAHTMIKTALAHWEYRTCLKFKKRTTQPDYIKFIPKAGCWSRVGFQGGAQEISVGIRCWTHGSIIHLIGHALGFLHEENRPDRDSWVQFHPENLKDGERVSDVFPKLQSSYFNWMSFGTPYDYFSCMHSRVDAHSKNGKVTLTPTLPKVPLVAVGDSSYGPSYLDFQQTNLLYKCPGDSGKYRGVICEHRKSTLSCFGGRKIKIINANYGRKKFSLCGVGFNLNCGKESSFKKVQELCNGKATCLLHASNSVFGDPCPLNLKYLDVSWECHP